MNDLIDNEVVIRFCLIYSMLGAEFPVDNITRVGISGKTQLIITKQILPITIKKKHLNC